MISKSFYYNVSGICVIIRSHILQQKYKRFKIQIKKWSMKGENACVCSVWMSSSAIKDGWIWSWCKKRICLFSLPVLSICLMLQGSSQASWRSGHPVFVYSWWFSSKMLTESSGCCARLRTESSGSSGFCYIQLPFLFHRYFRLWIS